MSKVLDQLLTPIIISKYKNGNSILNIAKELNISYKAVRNRVIKAGILRSHSEAQKGGKCSAWMLNPIKKDIARKKQSEIRKNLVKLGLYTPWNKGLTVNNSEVLRIMGSNRSKQYKGIQTNTGKSHFKIGHVPWHKGKKGVFSSKAIEKIREARLKQTFPTKDTIIELKIQKILEKAGIKFEKHYNIWHTQVDIAIPEKKIAIFVEGCYWHSCQDCFPIPKTKSQLKNFNWDNVKIKKVKELGWIVLRLWEHEIKKFTDEQLLEKVTSIIGMEIQECQQY